MFEVSADSYDRFMGRYSVQLAPQFVDDPHTCFSHVYFNILGNEDFQTEASPVCLSDYVTAFLQGSGAGTIAAQDPTPLPLGDSDSFQKSGHSK